MSDSRPSPLELRLSTMIDGECDARDRRQAEARLAEDGEARALQERLKRGTAAARHGFSALLKAPVPLDLVRAIRNTPLPRRVVNLPGTGSPAPSRLSAPQICVALLGALLVGTGFGYIAGAHPAISEIAPLSASATIRRDWLDDVVSHYRLHTRQPGRTVEAPADDAAEILQWLTTGTGIGFRIPDLNASGLDFLGARLFAAGGTPVGSLFYRRTNGEREPIAIAFTKTRPEDGRPFEEIRNDTGIVGWVTPLATYMIIGPSSAIDLDGIAAKVAGLI